MCIYLKNNPTKFYPDRTETTEPWTIFEERHPNNNKLSSDMGLVPDPKM